MPLWEQQKGEKSVLNKQSSGHGEKPGDEKGNE